jgi:uncharacterized membrane protein
MTTSTRDRGAVLPIVALALPVLMVMVAFAVDLGQQRSARRTMQARADIIALDMARLADGRTLQEILDGDDTHDSAVVALAASAARNNVPLAQIDDPEWGTWSEASGFVESTVPTSIPTAVHITARETTDYTFRPGTGNVVRDAIAMRGALPDDDGGDGGTDGGTDTGGTDTGGTDTGGTDTGGTDTGGTDTGGTDGCIPGDCPDPELAVKKFAGFSIGSFGARISLAQGEFYDQTISPILGDPGSVDALSYQGLSAATVRLWDVGAELDLVTTDEVLNTAVRVDDLMLATARVLRRSSDPDSLASASVLELMAATPETQALPPIVLGDTVVTAGQGGEDAAAGSTVDVLRIVRAAAYLSQCDDPTDISTCSGVNVPTLSTTLPLLSTTGSLRIIQGPASAYGPIGTSARNSQLSTTLGARLGGQYVGTCVPSLANGFCLLNDNVTGAVDAEVTVNATVDLANGEGTITDIRCGNPLGLDVHTTTGLYDVTLDVVVKFGQRGVLGGLIGPTIGTLHLVGTTQVINAGEPITFTVPPDELNVTTKEAGGGNIGLSTVGLATPDGTGVIGTLDTLGIVTSVSDIVANHVNQILVDIDEDILGLTADSLGVNIVGADVTAQRIDCFETVILVG